MLNIKLEELVKNIDEANITEVEALDNRDIAVIGICARLPMADSAREFMENLINGKNCITELPQTRKTEADAYLKMKWGENNEIRYKKGSYLEELDKFDCQFFNISPREASLMDPNQRMFLEVSCGAIEDAGYGGGKIRGSRTGVYFGFVSDLGYQRFIGDVEPASLGASIPGNMASIIPGRVSYTLDLTGPSMLIDTACSSSLVAIHTACAGIRSGDCDMALVGSGKLSLLPLEDDNMLGIESKKYECRAFDDDSDGTCMGEGIMAVLLKPLSKALKDMDNIYAVIKGSAINQDGTSMGLTAPNALAQADVIERAWKAAEVDPNTISYIEAHGTGTRLGDPIEIDGIKRAFSKYTQRKQFCAIGSVKTNLGHLDSAAGMVGFLKAILSLKNGILPPSLHFNTPNRNIDFENSPIFVNSTLTEWKKEDHPRRCGVSAFGLSGTNCHVILEEAPAVNSTGTEQGLNVLTLSARSKEGVEHLLKAYLKFLNKESNMALGDVCYTANTGRGHYKFRLAVIAQNTDELKKKLSKAANAGMKTDGENGIWFGEVRTVNSAEDAYVSSDVAETKRINQLAESKIKESKACHRQITLLKDICELYVMGAAIDWDDFYSMESFRKISLPTYPFERRRCWIELPSKSLNKQTEASINRASLNCGQRTCEEAFIDINETKVALKGRNNNEYTANERIVASIWGKALGFDEFNVCESFYEVGGDSVIAIELCNNINRKLGLSIKVSDLLRYDTIESISKYLDSLTGKVKENSVAQDKEVCLKTTIMPIEEAEYYSLSSAQTRVILSEQLGATGMAYNTPSALMIEGQLDKEKTERIFKLLIERHEVLRTSFGFKDGVPFQKVHKDVEFSIEEWTADEGELENIMAGFIRKFHLDSPPLLRVGLVRLEENKYILLLDMHHIITDGMSLSILSGEFIQMYGGRELPEMRIQYKDFAKWHNDYLNCDELKKQEDYWVSVYQDGVPSLDIKEDFKRPVYKSSKGDTVFFKIDEKLLKGLEKRAASKDATLYMLLLSAYYILISKYSGQEDIVVGSPVTGRTNSETEKLIGMLVNTLAIRNFPSGEKKFEDFLQEVKKSCLLAYENQDYPFEALVDKLKTHRETGRNPIFDTVFVFQNTYKGKSSIPGLTFSPYDLNSKIAKFDFMLEASVNSGVLEFKLEYCTEIFKRETMERMAAHYVNILKTIEANHEINLFEIEVLSSNERNRILYDFNKTDAEYPREKSIHTIFEEQAKRVPDNIALVFENNTMTYRELNEKSNRLARLLMEKGVEKESIVGIMTEPCFEMIIGILAVLKAGGAYLPLRTDYPDDRIRFMLEDSGASLILTREENFERVQYVREKVDIEAYCNRMCDGTDLNLPYSPGQAAYVIYTSGTTGKPKGVLIEHKNVVRLFINDKMLFDFDENDVWSMFHSFCFDFSVWEMYGALLFGGRLVLVPRDVAKSALGYLTLLRKEKITVLNQTPTAFYNLIREEMETHDKELAIRYVIFGGEALKPVMLRPWAEKYPDCTLVNMYGITETTVHVTYKLITGSEIEGNISNIGRPIPTMTAYILDKNMVPVPVGVTGELYVGGHGVGRGYLNRPELNKSRFIQNPYKKGEIIYKSGDLARFLPNGEIEYVGRIDHQVKIRGHRIELREIELRLSEYEAVKEAVIIDLEDIDGGKVLCAYYIADQDLSVRELKNHLSKSLPEYMLPAYFERVDKIYLNVNGKVDRSQLPKPGRIVNTGVEYVAPDGVIEEELSNILMNILGVEKIGVHDNFFDLGGHSLKASVFAATVSARFNIKMPLTMIFEKPTIKELGEYIKSADETSYTQIKKAFDANGYYPVSSAQKRIYVLSLLEGADISYNIPQAMIIEGTPDEEKILNTLNKLVQRHESLRTSFEVVEGELVQIVNEVTPVCLEVIESTNDDMLRTLKSFVRPFDLKKAPLLRVGIIKVEGGRQALVFDMHHIISDGVSADVFIRDFMNLYQGKKLPELELGYKDYAVWQKESIRDGELKQQQEYWSKRLSGRLPVLNLPTDYRRPTLQSFEGECFTIGSGKVLSDKLKELEVQKGVTLYMILLAAYNVMLYKYTGQKDIIVGTPTAGRCRKEMEDVIGMFVNTLPMRNFPEANKTFDLFLEEIKENALMAFENQEYQLDELADKLDIQRDLSRNPIYDTLLAVQNMDITDLEIDGLKIEKMNFDSGISKLDLSIYAMESRDETVFCFEYCTKLFTRETIRKMAMHYMNILEIIASEPQIKISEIEMLSSQEKVQQLKEFNNTNTFSTDEKTVHEMFEKRVKMIPDYTAVVYKGVSLTYRELNYRANQLARFLEYKGVRYGSIVGLMVQRSEEMLVGMMGILKAGGAYLPIDPSYPEERIKYMIENSGTKHILFNGERPEKLKFNGQFLDIKDPDVLPLDGANLEKNVSLRAPAYVIYTSGSTGKPKGVVIEHRSVYYFICGVSKAVNYSSFQAILAMTTLSFDIHVLETLMALAEGLKIVVADEKMQLDPAALNGAITKNKVDILQATPSRLQLLFSAQGMKAAMESVKAILVGGEPLTEKLLEEIRQISEASIFNMYGPTETTVWSSVKELTGEKRITIGKPIDGTRMYILDENFRLLPIGAIGELWIAGFGLARGYLDNPELTGERFIKCPFEEGNRMYRTGDLARWLPDGNIEYIGRMDNQVKIRGFRIETGEIEGELLKLDGINEAIVSALEDDNGNRYLCAYIVSKVVMSVAQIREHLSKTLPEYMIPSYFIQLESMPMTPGGKADKKALPKPDGNINTGATYVAPESETEREMVEVWSSVLGLEKVGIKDNFFYLGGDSIKALQMMAALSKYKINLSDLFKYPTIFELSKVVKQEEAEDSKTEAEFTTTSLTPEELDIIKEMIK